VFKSIFLVLANTALVISCLVLPSCDSSTCSSSPLKKIDQYQVMLLISPYGDLNPEEIKKLLREKLTSLGQVVESKIPISEENPVLFISIEPKESTNLSTIQVISKVKVLKNGCELASVIWSHPFKPKGSLYPIEQGGKIVFLENEVSEISQHNSIDYLLDAFAKEYKAAHSKDESVTFLISE